MIKVKERKFKGKPTLEFWDEAAKPGAYYGKIPFFVMGVKKCGIVVDNIEAIKEFLQAHQGGVENESQ